jgi:hypothetical protein
MRRGLFVAAVLVALGLQVPEQLGELARALPEAAHWADADEQHRAILDDVPFDLLRLADERMPRGASVLLVTPGTDVRHREYSTFHRALYFLAPRPVRWITPAARDGTYEGEWWTPAAITPASICEEAGRAAATYLLLLDLPAPAVPCTTGGWTVEALPGGTLVSLERPGTGAPSGAAWTTGGLSPWWPILLLIALAIPLLIGWALVTAALREGSAITGAQRAGLAWALGAGAVTLGLLGLGAIGLPAGLRMGVLALGAVAAAAWVARAARRASPDVRALRGPRRVPRSVAERLLLAVIGGEVLLVAVLAIGRPLSVWDGWAHWGMKARVIFLEGGITSTIYADATRSSTHLAYPLHLPLLESWVYSWLGTPDDRLVGVLGVASFVALIAFCHGTLRHWGANRVTALALTAVLGSLVFVWRLAAAGFAEVPLAVLVTGAAVLLVEWLERADRRALVLACAAAGLLGWTKMEGLVLLAVLLMVVGAMAVADRSPGLRARARRALVGLVAGGLLLSGGWWAFVAAAVQSPTEYRLNLAEAAANLGRLPTIAVLQFEMLAWPAWSFLWPVAAVAAIVIGVVRLTRRGQHPNTADAIDRAWLLPSTAALYLGAMSGAYLVTTFAPYTEQIEASGFRLALQVLPMTLLWLGRRALPIIEPAMPRDRPDALRSSAPVRSGAEPPAASPAAPG